MESERRTDTTAVPRITPNSWAVFSPSPRGVGLAVVEGNSVAEKNALGVVEIVRVMILVGVTSEFVTNSEDGESVLLEMLDRDSGVGVIPPVIPTGDAVGGGMPLVTPGVKLPSSTLANLVL